MSKLDTNHLVLKPVLVNGKMQHRWVDPHKDDKEHAQYGSKITFEHHGKEHTGTVGSVIKSGEYAVKGDNGIVYNKHKHQFDSPHKESASKTKEEPKKKKTWRDFISYNESSRLSESIKRSTEKELRTLLVSKINKRDHSMTPSRDKQRIKEEVWDLEKILKAYDKANEHNSQIKEEEKKNDISDQYKESDLHKALENLMKCSI